MVTDRKAAVLPDYSHPGLSLDTQLELFGSSTQLDIPVERDVSTTFESNLRLPVHRWYRYSAGFSAGWVQDVVRQHGSGAHCRVLDPFAGSGTTVIAAQDCGADAIGLEAHPLVARLAKAKLHSGLDPQAFQVASARVAATAARASAGDLTKYADIIAKCYSVEALSELDRLRTAVAAENLKTPEGLLAWFALVAILRRTSHVGTAQWQYLLPTRTKARVESPIAAYRAMSTVMADDMRTRSRLTLGAGEILETDARTCAGVEDGWAQLVITSPPYPNNYDYADATRLEMSFLGEIANWGDLQQAVRSKLVRACSQHVPEKAVNLPVVLADPVLAPIAEELVAVCAQLGEIRLTKGGKKTYHLMVACYFLDLARTWHALRRVTAPRARVCCVVGDSAPYGIYVPVMTWLPKLAESAGFTFEKFEQTRERNVKWKNRKHRVPLCEGRLWLTRS